MSYTKVAAYGQCDADIAVVYANSNGGLLMVVLA